MRRKSDPALSALVIIELVILFLAVPLTAMHRWPVALDVVLLVMLAAVGIVVVSRNRTAFTIILFTFAASLITTALSRFVSSTLVHYVDFFTNLIFIGALTWEVGVATFAHGKITLHRIQGAIAIYLQIAMIFALLYLFLLYLSADAFSPPISVANSGMLSESFSSEPRVIYFSFVTLTSTGYGDLVPVNPVARSLANLEAIIGQLFPATLLARLVTLELKGRGD